MSEPRPIVAVGAVVVRDEALLMVQRANEPGKGLWSIPGGRVEAGEYLSDAVRREVREETGLDVTVRDLLGILEVRGEPHYVILDYVAHVEGDAAPRASGDAADAQWVPLERVSTLECTPRFVETMTAWGVLADE